MSLSFTDRIELKTLISIARKKKLGIVTSADHRERRRLKMKQWRESNSDYKVPLKGFTVLPDDKVECNTCHKISHKNSNRWARHLKECPYFTRHISGTKWA